MANPIYAGSHKLATRHSNELWGVEELVDGSDLAFKANEVTAFTALPEMLQDRAIGQTFKEFVRSGRIVVEPGIVGDLFFDGSFITFLATLLGADAVTPGTGFATHVMTIQPQSCKYQTVALQDGTSDIVKVIPSFKTSAFTIAGVGAGYYTWTLAGMGNEILMPGVINTGITAATYKDKTNVVPFGVTRFLMNDQGAAALSPAADALNIDSLSLPITRAINAQFNGNAVASSDAAWRTAEPLENDFATITLTTRFPTLISNARLKELKSGQLKKGTIFMQGIGITGATPPTSYSILIELPALRIINVVHSGITGREHVVEEVTFEALAAQSSPLGFTFTQPIRCTIVNATLTSYIQP